MKIIILTAKCGLGTYIPAVYTYKYLTTRNVKTELLVWEDFYETNNQEKSVLYQKNPRIAEVAYAYDGFKQTRTNSATKIKEVLSEYVDDRITYVCFSGIWYEELLYQQKIIRRAVLNVVMDAYHSTLWVQQIEDEKTNTATLYALGKHIYTLNNDIDIIAYKNRKGILVQGGGWNLNNSNQISYFQKLIKEDVTIALTNDDPKITGAKIQYHMGSKCDFPYPVNREYDLTLNYHPLLDEYNKAICCIGKPGGMTIIDSIMTCTPLLLTDITIGQHEKANREFCKKYNLAYELQTLSHSQIEKQLEELHERLFDILNSTRNLCLSIYNFGSIWITMGKHQ